MTASSDCRGVPLSAESDDALAAFDETVAHFMGLRADTGDVLKSVFEADPEMPMAHCLKGYFMKLMCGTAYEAKAKEASTAANAFSAKYQVSDREQAHIDALAAWAQGDLTSARDRWESILINFPLDVLALRLSHFIHFYLGDAPGLRDSVARVYPCWDETVPGYGYVTGYYAFGHEECGAYVEAERLGRQAVDINPADIWSTHAVAHVMEMNGRIDEGIDWLEGLSENWEGCNNFAYHAWWHLALFYLAKGDTDRVLELYDTRIRAEETDDYLDLTNAISLLWRLEEMETDVGDRWGELAEKSSQKTGDRIFAFHDAHYLMALCHDGKAKEADTMIQAVGEDMVPGIEGAVYEALGAPLCRAIKAYAVGDFGVAVDLLYPVRRELYRIGGSHAQRDLFARLLISAGLKAGRFRLVRALLAERLGHNPSSAWNWRRMRDAFVGLEDRAGAERAEDEYRKLNAN
ncbi:MAG TPA: tetratricopeptide repeat-containing protein [Rhodospirillaceae bacterium]|nr:tetratricopeptide repeat-containing protein [Rhodospirillaceae bacterium]